MQERLPMSFREKSAWITFVSLLAVFTPFFYFSYRTITGAVRHREAVPIAFGLLATFVALEVLAHGIAAVRAPQEARSPRDERERSIELRATRLAFTVLVLGALAAAATLHLSTNPWVMQQAVLFALVVAELVKYGAQIVLFRRDA